MRARVAILSFALGACSVPSVTFTDQVDGNPSVVDTSTHADTMPGAVDIIASPTTLTVGEGSAQTFQITLSGPPVGTVLVTATSSDDNKLGVTMGGTAIFDGTTWDKPAMVMLTGKQDPDSSDEAITVTVASTSSSVQNGATVDVTVVDDEKLALRVSPSTLDVTEGASAPLAVHLSAQPASDVVVDAASDDLAVATVTPAKLTFTSANFATDQTITVSGVSDANLTVDSANIGFSSTALTTIQVPVHVTDVNVLAIEPSTTSIPMNEGEVKTLTIALTQQPTQSVMVTIASSDAGAASAAPAALTFTPSNYAQPQTVTVTAPQDVDTGNEAVALSLSATGLSTRTVAVAVTDDDTQVLVATPASATITEAGTATVGVHLAFRPATDVTVAVTSLATSVATASPAQLIFSPSSYQVDQPVTLSAPADADAVDGATTLRLAAAADGLVTDVPVAVHDDDTLGIQASTASITFDEGSTGTFQVRLTAQPAADVQVAVVSTDVGAATVSTGALTFTTASWNTYQTVTVTGVVEPDTADEDVAISLTAPGMAAAGVTAHVIDTTALGITTSVNTTTVTEGASSTFTAQLTAQPPGNVTVTVTAADPTIATVSPVSLTFTPADWNSAQVVTVFGALDANATDDPTAIDLAATGLATRTVTVTVKDADIYAIDVSPPSVNVTEGGTASAGVRLTAQPPATTMVMVTSSNTAKATVAPVTLTFTTGNWSTSQNVIVTGVDDADAADESLSLSATGTGLPARTVPVTVIDDEILGIVSDATSVSLAEGGTATFHVHLAAQPVADTTVAVSSSDTGAATAAPATLTFTTADWAADQTVTVTGIQDNDLADESASITLASSGFPNRLVSATVTDDDTQIVQASVATLSVNEGTTKTVGVSLGFQPAANVVVSVTSGDAGVATGAPASLSFTPQSYATPQLVTVSGTLDANAISDATTMTFSASGATSATVAVTVPDKDTLGIATTAPSVTLGEAGTATVGVHLTAQPQANVTVAVASNDTAAATAAPASLVFTPVNWATDQTVTITGVNDVDTLDEHPTLTASAATLTSATVAVTVTDDDTVLIVSDAASITLAEGGTGTFHVKLAAQPQASVTVAVASPDTGAATVSPATLTFTTSTWNTNQTVTVTGVQDLDVADESVALTLTSGGLPSVGVTAGVTDDDVEQILVSTGTATVSEGASTTVGVTLRYVPSANVTVAVASGDGAIATISPATLTFTPGNYNVPQNVTITGVQDANAVANSTTVSLTSPGVTSASVAVTVNDNDVLLIKPSTASVTVVEGATATFTVNLQAQPLANVTVAVASQNTNAATASPATLTFTPQNWNVAQTVTVTGAQDANLASESTSIKLSAAGLPDASVSVSVTDDDTQTILVSTSTVLVNESASTTFTVSLQYVPAANVTVNVASLNTAVATAAPSALSFTSANYATPQTVTVTGVHDANTVSDSTTLGVTATGANGATVTVNVNDIDVIGITTDVSSVTVQESATSTFNVHLTAQPAASVTVNVASLSSAVATVSPATLTFTTSTWNVNQPVTVTGAHDVNLVDDSTSMKLSATGMNDVLVPTTVVDRDVQTVLTSVATVGLTEGQAGTVGVTLQYVPTASVTVTIASGNTAVATASPASLTFTPQNYATSQNVTVTAVQDADAVGNTTAVTMSAPGATSGSVNVNVADDDTLGIAVSTGALTVSEGSTNTFQVSLTAQPLANQTVNVSSNNTAAATVSAASLTFTPQSWNVTQTITVTGVSDQDLVNGAATVSLSNASMTTQPVSVSVIDDDTETIVASTTSTTIVEAGTGSTTTVGISLVFIPTSNVTVTVASANTNIATVGPATLTFTPQNYATAQNITIAGVHDVNVNDNTTTISLTAPMAIGTGVSTTVRDVDVLALVVSANALGVGEGGANTFKVHLSNLPNAGFPVNVGIDNPGAATVSPTTLGFTTANWNVDQTVTVAGVQDLNLTNEGGTISLTASGVATATVSVTVTDDDVQQVVVDQSAILMAETKQTTARVWLAYQPSADVVVTLAPTTGSLIVGPASLTFTPQNYSTPQTIAITANADANKLNDSFTVTASAPNAGSASISVLVQDRGLILINPPGGFKKSAGTCICDLGTLGVHLSDAPLFGPMTVTITSTGGISTSMTFDSSNYATEQFLDVMIGDGTITLSAPDQLSVSAAVEYCGLQICM